MGQPLLLRNLGHRRPNRDRQCGERLGPQIAIDSSGNGLAVWHQYDGTRYNIWANRFTFASGSWGTAALIETDNAGHALNPQIAIDGSNNAFAVWYQHDGTRYNIWANRYSGSWGTSQLIESDNGEAFNPQIAFDGSGNAFAVWQQHDGTRYNIWANRFSSGAWGTAALIETNNSGHGANPQVAGEGSGNARAVWHQSDGARNSIWSARYVSGTGWGTPTLVETNDTGSANDPQIGVDGSGIATVAWYQYDGTRFNIWSNRSQ